MDFSTRPRYLSWIVALAILTVTVTLTFVYVAHYFRSRPPVIYFKELYQGLQMKKWLKGYGFICRLRRLVLVLLLVFFQA